MNNRNEKKKQFFPVDLNERLFVLQFIQLYYCVVINNRMNNYCVLILLHVFVIEIGDKYKC